MRGPRALAAIVTVVAWGALALQYAILAKALGFGLAAWRFVGFFTILTNLGVALIASGIALGRENRLTDAPGRLMGLTSIATVGITYSLLLRATWHPQGLQKVADVMLHDATPLLFLGLWLVMPHGKLGWRDLKWALAPPFLYFVYAMARGAIDGWYAYYFLNPATQSLGQLGLSVAGMLTIIAVIAAVAVAADMGLGRRGTEKAAA